jgi:short-subunit dehydrogenase
MGSRAAGLGWFAGAAALGVALGALRARRDAPTQSALVTGGSRGLGFLLAREYQRRGARVAICGRDADALRRAKARLDAEGPPVFAMTCDVSSRSEVDELVDAASRAFRGIDTLVNNAGIIGVGPDVHMNLGDYEDAMRVNFFGALHVTRAVLPQMRRRRRGRVVNVASIAGLVPVPHMLPYTASKFALTGWSEGLRAELAVDGVRVTTVCPALMRTGSPRHASFKGRHREEYAWFSIADATPGITIGAERAAARIVRAGERGRARLVLPVYMRLPVALHAAAPGLTLGVLARAHALLPAPGGIGEGERKGSESESRWSPSLLTALDERAARRFNQLGGTPRAGAAQDEVARA